MARGKKAASATKRREVAEVEAELATAQQATANALRQCRDLEAKLAEHRDNHVRIVADLTKRLEAAASPLVDDLRAQVATLDGRLGELTEKHRGVQANWDRACEEIIRRLKGDGLSGTEAVEELLRITGHGNQNTTILDGALGKTLPVEAVRTIQRARGVRAGTA